MAARIEVLRQISIKDMEQHAAHRQVPSESATRCRISHMVAQTGSRCPYGKSDESEFQSRTKKFENSWNFVKTSEESSESSLFQEAGSCRQCKETCNLIWTFPCLQSWLTSFKVATWAKFKDKTCPFMLSRLLLRARAVISSKLKES